MELPWGLDFKTTHFVWILTQTTWEFMWGVCVNATIDQYDLRNHRGTSCLVLLWNIRQRTNRMCSRHHVEPIGATNFGNCVTSFKTHWAQHGQGEGCDYWIQRGHTLKFFG
jgi:hypothetical protein